jgi:hypothetical protein
MRTAARELNHKEKINATDKLTAIFMDWSISAACAWQQRWSGATGVAAC